MLDGACFGRRVKVGFAYFTTPIMKECDYMILLTTYLIIGLGFALYVFGVITVKGNWDFARSEFEKKYDGFNFQAITTLVFITYVLLWPGYLAMYINKYNKDH